VTLALLVGTAAATLAACSKKGPPAPPAVEVSTVTVKPQAATVGTDYVVQTEAVNTVEIRPRVGGVLEKQAANRRRAPESRRTAVRHRPAITARSLAAQSNRSAIWQR
jgi:hypothetical protein